MSGFGAYEDEDYLATGVVLDGDSDPYLKALRQIREEVSNTFSLSAEQLANAGDRTRKDVEALARRTYINYNEAAAAASKPMIALSVDDFCNQVRADLLGMGALEPLLADQTIEDIAINGPTEVCLFRNGDWEVSGLKFDSPERLLEIMNRALATSNRKVNPVSPIADGILPGRQRINVVTYPITDTWPSAVIRIQRAKGITLGDMVSRPPYRPDADELVRDTPLPDYASMYAGGMISGEAASYLHAAVLAGLNIAVIGPTGVGKTTLLTALARCIPQGQRILIIEDTPEIVINPDDPRPHNVLYLRTREANTEGISSVTQEHLVRLALRQRPDALTLGEARGPEVFDLLNALNTGHRNGLTSLHSEGFDQLFDRVYMMLAQSERGRRLDAERAARLVASTLNIVITLELDGRNRQIKSIVEFPGTITGGASPSPVASPVFMNSGNGIGKMLRETAFTDRFLSTGVSKKYWSPE